MTEYSRATGRGHQESAGERDMEVEKQPSPWPCVVMLVGLLLCCLAAPRYWQHDGSPTSSADVEFASAHVANGLGIHRPNCDACGSTLPGSRFDFGDMRSLACSATCPIAIC